MCSLIFSSYSVRPLIYFGSFSKLYGRSNGRPELLKKFEIEKHLQRVRIMRTKKKREKKSIGKFCVCVWMMDHKRFFFFKTLMNTMKDHAIWQPKYRFAYVTIAISRYIKFVCAYVNFYGSTITHNDTKCYTILDKNLLFSPNAYLCEMSASKIISSRLPSKRNGRTAVGPAFGSGYAKLVCATKITL